MAARREREVVEEATAQLRLCRVASLCDSHTPSAPRRSGSVRMMQFPREEIPKSKRPFFFLPRPFFLYQIAF